MNLLLLLAALAMALAWLLPGHYMPWLTFHQEFAAACGAVLAGIALAVSRTPVRVPWLAVVALMAAAVSPLQYALGRIHFLSDATLAAGYVGGFALALVVGASLSRRELTCGDPPFHITLLYALAGAAAASSLMAVMQWQGVGTGAMLDAAPRGWRYFANFAQPNNLATALGIGLCGVLLAHCRHALSGPVTTLLVALIGAGLVTTQSRTGWLFVGVLSLWLVLLRQRAQLPIARRSVVTALTLFVLANLAWPPLNAALDMAPQVAVADRVGGVGLRTIHWQVILEAIAQRPWFGWGWTQVAFAQQATVLGHPATGEVLTASHNIVLDLLVWNGIPLGVLFTAALAWWFVRHVLACRDAESALGLAAVAALCIHALLELPHEYAFFLLPIGFVMGSFDKTDVAAAWQQAKRRTLAGGVALAAALTAFVGYEYFQVESTSRVMRFVAMGIGVDKVNNAPEPEVVLLDRPRHLHRFMLQRAQYNPDPAYLEWVRIVATRHSTAPAMLRYAIAAGINGRVDESRLVLERLCRIHSADRCREGRAAWTRAQANFPELRAVAYPPDPPRG